MGKKERKEEEEDWHGLSPSRSSTEPSALGKGKSFGDSGTPLGHPLLTNTFYKRLWLKVMLPIVHFKQRKTKWLKPTHFCLRKKKQQNKHHTIFLPLGSVLSVYSGFIFFQHRVFANFYLVLSLC